MTVALADQIAAVERVAADREVFNRARVARAQMSQPEATAEALTVNAALETLRWLRTNEAKIKARVGDGAP